MGKRFWIISLKRTGLALAICFFVGFFCDKLFNESNPSPFRSGLIVIALYMAASTLVMLVNLLSGLAYSSFFQNRILQDAFLDDLRNAKIPYPRSHDPKRFEYISDIADDEEEEPNLRVRCAAFYTANETSINGSGFFNSISVRKAIDLAIIRYAQEAPLHKKRA